MFWMHWNIDQNTFVSSKTETVTIMTETKKIGQKIADARKRIHISQAELAQKLFISPQAVGKWERGESMPDITTLSRLALILDVDLNYFSDRFESTKMSSNQSEHPHDPEEGKPSSIPHKNSRRQWDMSEGNWVDADFSGMKGLQEKFSASNMKNCKFVGSEMSGLMFNKNNIEQCDFTDSDLKKSSFRSSYLSDCRFSNCSLEESVFADSVIGGCNLNASNFTRTEFLQSYLFKSSVEDALWKNTTFKDSSLADIVFQGVIDDCAFEFCAFKNVTFKHAILTNTFFKCKTLKRIKFIDCVADRMTYEFLKNGKANLEGITLQP
jgi:uncharacterized protein YjbI with pentapeptide repeats